MTEKEIVIDMRELIHDISKKLDKDQSVILRGEGKSMTPFITDQDVITLKKPENNRVKTGEIYLYKRDNGSYAIHRVYAVRKEFVFMLGDAQLFIEKVHKRCLVAVVVTVEKPDRTIDCTEFSIRMRNVIYMKFRIFKEKYKLKKRNLFVSIMRLLSKVKKMLMKER